MKKSDKKKRKKPRASFVISVDNETGELLEFPWHEDEDHPPIIKLEKDKKKTKH